MKKSLIALAVLAASGAAMAQSSVTLYGLIDLGIAQSKDDRSLPYPGVATGTFKKTGMESMINGPRIGFKGSEDLGGGLKGNFLLEYGVQPDDGASSTTMNNRQSYVGLSGGFGEVRLGRQYTAYHNHQGGFDMVNGNTNTLVGNAVTTYTSRVRASNAIQYATPTVGGFSGLVQYGFGESVKTATDGKKNDNWGLNLKYANGPLAVGYGYDQVKNLSGASSTTLVDPALINRNPVTGATPTNKGFGVAGFNGSSKVQVHGLGASYDFGVAKLAAQVFSGKESDVSGTAGLEGKVTGYNLGVSVPFGQMTLAASISGAKLKEGGTEFAKAKDFQLLATYALSKRTTAYAAYGQDKLENSLGSGEDKRRQYGVGLRHTF